MKHLYFSIAMIFLIFLLSPWNLWAACTASGTDWLSSPDYASLNSCVSQADAGDTINISGTSSTWSSSDTLTITKPLTLQGTGSFNEYTNVYTTGTKITRGGTSGSIIKVDNSSNNSIMDGMKIIGIHFDRVVNDGEFRPTVWIKGGDYSDGEMLTDLIISNCRFDEGWAAILVYDGLAFGVISENYFQDINRGIQIEGHSSEQDYPDDSAWTVFSYEPGTEDMLFFEDNYFYWTSGAAVQDGTFYNVRGGARLVVRYNEFDYSDCSTCSSVGVLHLYKDWGYTGHMLTECYENTINMGSYAQNVFGTRGGSILLYNNTVTSSAGQFAAFGATCPDPNATDPYPIPFQVNNSFVWGNTLQGSPYPVDYDDVVNNSCTTNGVKVGIEGDGTAHTEVWLHEPESSGGKNVYPGDPGDTDMYFTSSGANAYYPYTPYTYPHPLRGSNSGAMQGIVLQGGSIQ